MSIEVRVALETFQQEGSRLQQAYSVGLVEGKPTYIIESLSADGSVKTESLANDELGIEQLKNRLFDSYRTSESHGVGGDNAKSYELTRKKLEEMLAEGAQLVAQQGQQIEPTLPAEQPPDATYLEEEIDSIRPVSTMPVNLAQPVLAHQGKDWQGHADKLDELAQSELDADQQTDVANVIQPLARDDAKAKKTMPETLLDGRFIRDEKGSYHRRGETAPVLVDKGQQIQFKDKKIEAFKAGVELAAAKGWTAIEVTGTKRFRAEAWVHAKLAGLDVVGYEPSQKDLERFEALNIARQVKRPDGHGFDGQPLPAGQAEGYTQLQDYALLNAKGIVQPDLERGNYAGRVLKENDTHVLLSVNGRAGTTTILAKDQLPPGTKIETGEVLSVRFRDGKAVVPQTKEKAHALER
ncbi:LPD7 domain-containing protein [Chromobacterium vaccinii]|uniref:LPD7 domain-containing protein n=1 Tax=Chromobacterium vaccinii TaxID=1108595 RepID=UPI003C77EA99